MSAPKTNIEKQERRHRGPLAGMWIVVGLVLLGFLVWLIWVFAVAEPDDEVVGDEVPGVAESVDTTAPTGTIEPGEEQNAPAPPPEANPDIDDTEAIAPAPGTGAEPAAPETEPDTAPPAQ